GASTRRHRAAGGVRGGEVLPQPRARPRPRAVRARGRRARLGELGPRDRGSARTRAGARVMSLDPREILIAPVVSEKSYSLIEDNKYSFRVHSKAHKTQIRQ